MQRCSFRDSMCKAFCTLLLSRMCSPAALSAGACGICFVLRHCLCRPFEASQGLFCLSSWENLEHFRKQQAHFDQLWAFYEDYAALKIAWQAYPGTVDCYRRGNKREAKAKMRFIINELRMLKCPKRNSIS